MARLLFYGLTPPTSDLLSFADAPGEKISLCSVSATARDYYGLAYETDLWVAQAPTNKGFVFYSGADIVLDVAISEVTIPDYLTVGSLGSLEADALVKTNSSGRVSPTLELPAGLTVGGSTLHLAAHYATTITGTGALSSFTVTHSMGTRDVVVSIIDTTTGANQYYTVQTAWKADTTNTVIVYFNTAPPSGTTYRVVVVGYK